METSPSWARGHPPLILPGLRGGAEELGRIPSGARGIGHGMLPIGRSALACSDPSSIASGTVRMAAIFFMMSQVIFGYRGAE